ncbi:hypothetical protein ACTWP4_16450 [Gracilibacillus sp. D59]|uniref:hypothetical protein n=1 Tax=Gracilibacillus sp. D59 TaxID=3457434 RepID=UPI003FCC94C7
MIKRILFLFVFIISVLGACSQHEAEEPSVVKTSEITLDEVKTAITEQGLELAAGDLPSVNAFIQELNGVSPKAYFIDGTTLSI